MFTEIYMLDYQTPMPERLRRRKYAGPYRWRPAEPGKGRGFYQARNRDAATGDPEMDRQSTLRLRLQYANDLLPEGSRLRHTSGYFADSFQDATLTPIVAPLPHSRGYLAGWTMGAGMCATLAPEIYDEPEDAARAAHDEAERSAIRAQEEELAETYTPPCVYCGGEGYHELDCEVLDYDQTPEA